jgi:lipid A 3-O-deacylase
LPSFVQTTSILSGFEFRAGVFGSTWGPERAEPYLNGEVIFPKFLRAEGWVDYLMPRLQAGGMANVGGGTSYLYAGPVWTAKYERVFADFSVGGSIHDGETQGHYTDRHRNKMGCRVLYHVGADLGYQLSDNWSAMLTFDHISDGNGTLSSCGANEGATVLGVRLGYTF